MAEINPDPLLEALDVADREAAMTFTETWFAESQRWLENAARRRSDQMDGKSGLMDIHESAVEPYWDGGRGAAVFEYPHHGAVFQEYGARPHDIRAKEAEVLAFEWPEAPAEVKEEFSHTEGDLVFFEEVGHPGIPPVAFVRTGRQKAMERRGGSR